MDTADLIFAAGESCANIFYASGFQAPDPFIYFACRHEKAVIVSALEQDRAEKECKPDVAVLERNSFQGGSPDNIDVICSLAASREISAFRVPYDFPLGLAEALRGRGLQILPETGVFYPQRQFKGPEELAALTAALRVAEAGMRRALTLIAEAVVRPDGVLEHGGEVLTSEILRAEINIAMIRLGGFSDATIAACGAAAAEPHNVGSGPLTAGKTIILDIFPRIRKTGYWGDLTRTVVKGKAPEIVKNAYLAVREAREYAKTLIRPGAVPAEVHRAALKLLDDHGFRTGRRNGHNFGFFHGLGHSLGLEIHEKPALSPVNNEPLQGGEVLTVEPGLYYPEWGGVRLEDVVAVTADGCRCLTEIGDIPEIQ
ncbi:MAG: Xaa-Pro peptidase family protein [Victivallales bacterium]|nr:Xaa-Pro peptidase family protein [Victivallales bacterium]